VSTRGGDSFARSWDLDPVLASGGRLVLLAVLCRADVPDDGLPAVELARRSGGSDGGVSHAVRALVEAGYAERRERPSQNPMARGRALTGRETVYLPTQEGRGALARHWEVLARLRAGACAKDPSQVRARITEKGRAHIESRRHELMALPRVLLDETVTELRRDGKERP
jgi:DNA-binding MarR family transcriptional regulator